MPSSVNLQISEVRPATNEEWDDTWAACGYSTYFHSREWAGIWALYTKGHIYSEPRLVTFSDGQKALLPFSSAFIRSERTKYGWFPDSWDLREISRGRRSLSSFYRGGERRSYGCYNKSCISSPMGTYGGWISGDELGPGHAAVLALYLAGHYEKLSLRTSPYTPYLAEKLSEVFHDSDISDDETYSLDLSSGFDPVYMAWKKGSQGRKAAKASKAGVTVSLARTIEDWKGYFGIYRDSIRRWGDAASSRYGWSLFEYMQSIGSSNIRLWLAHLDNRVVAGALCVYSKNIAVYWHGAALEEYFGFRPVNMVFHEAVRDAAERGVSWFDFNPCGGHEGVKKFKKSFYASPLPSRLLEFRRDECKGIVARMRRFRDDVSETRVRNWRRL